MIKTVSYKDAGVDIDAGEAFVDAIKPALATTARPETVGGIGGFGGIFDLAKSGYKDPLLVSATDGVGTKLKIAVETGRHDTVGIDLVAMCVNDLIVQGAEPLFFLDYLATSKLDLETATDVVRGIAAGCAEAGCALIGGETAELPGFYSGDDYDLAGFAVGAVEREALLPKQTISDGDAVIGLAASGVHSNGFSLVRRIIERKGLSFQSQAPFESNLTLGEACLTPTRIYVRSILAALKAQAPIKALAHITGGGLVENLPRVLPDGLGAKLDLSDMKRPPIFDWLAESGPVDAREMSRTFNCGVGMIVIVPNDSTDDVCSEFVSRGVPAWRIGTLSSSDRSDRVQVRNGPGV